MSPARRTLVPSRTGYSRRMKYRWAWLALSVTLACGHGPRPAPTPAPAQRPPPTTPPARDVHDISSFVGDPWVVRGPGEREMIEFMRAMCACHDRPCADRVQAEMNAWTAKTQAELDQAPTNDMQAPAEPHPAHHPRQPPPEVMKRMQEIGTRYGECMAQAFEEDRQRH